MEVGKCQYPKRRLSVRSRKISKPRDLYLELSDRSEIWQALRQQCCRCACQISKRYDNWKYQSHGFETLRDLTKRRLFGYWDGALYLMEVPLYFTPWNLMNPIYGSRLGYHWFKYKPAICSVISHYFTHWLFVVNWARVWLEWNVNRISRKTRSWILRFQFKSCYILF